MVMVLVMVMVMVKVMAMAMKWIFNSIDTVERTCFQYQNDIFLVTHALVSMWS